MNCVCTKAFIIFFFFLPNYSLYIFSNCPFLFSFSCSGHRFPAIRKLLFQIRFGIGLYHFKDFIQALKEEKEKPKLHFVCVRYLLLTSHFFYRLLLMIMALVWSSTIRCRPTFLQVLWMLLWLALSTRRVSSCWMPSLQGLTLLSWIPGGRLNTLPWKNSILPSALFPLIIWYAPCCCRSVCLSVTFNLAFNFDS